VHDLDTNARLGTTAQVEGSLENPHDLVDRLSLEILRILLGGEAADLPRVDLAAVTTTSTPALRAYLRGERAYRQGSFEEAAEAYQEAVAIDSTFALAHFRLDLAAGWGGAPDVVLNQARARSRALADRLPERERLLVTGYLQWTRSETNPAVLTSPAQRAAELYANDAEVVYILAETYFHSRNMVKSVWEVDELFQRAVELDPGFAPYRIHPVELAFNLHGDSALAAERVAEYASIVNDPTDPRVEGNDRGLRVVFGDDLARAAVLDSLAQGLDRNVWNVFAAFLLSHSRSLGAEEAFFEVQILRRAPAPGSLAEAQLHRDLGRNLANQGRISDALAILDRPELAGFGQRTCLIAEYRFLGIAVPDEMVREAAANAGNPIGAFQDAFCGGLLAAELGLRPAFDAGRTRLETFAPTSAAARDEIPHLDVFWEWKQGATPRPEVARSLAGVGDTNAAPYWAFWLGELHREAGNLREAERAYLTTQLTTYYRGRYTLAWWHLAGIYRELGDPVKERDALGRVVAAWENADPEIQPRVEEAVARLAALQP
jgi:tetratricopeptide (TPR) repeat protein